MFILAINTKFNKLSEVNYSSIHYYTILFTFCQVKSAFVTSFVTIGQLTY